ncbi:MAG: bifunctional (p)ppGpp synthetase/guanosine-3',5'-bis(diphosphate) 3'-pyrophosphohydrolase [Peptostreptococcaceae bacterium]|nr:bifunctional (p)ppGpp synthetase/guanosine-3',5'-bis(diphosphate) 3'-pyrophosphohydrolase [Peptostreptococcaceae bacterium]
MDEKSFFIGLAEINPKYDNEIIRAAYDKAYELHKGQLRRSGEPYIIHPLNVALVLARLGMDNDAIVGGLLHDVVEDTDYTRENLVEDFGEDVAVLVDGVTKLGNIVFGSMEELQAENFRKMFLAMAKDIRVLIIKLADRLHNMRTLEYMPTEKKVEKARETLEIYAPLASRLGIYSIKFELEDLSLKYLHPADYTRLSAQVTVKKTEREKIVLQLIEEIKENLDQTDIQYDIKGRSKHLYSIYKKMVIQQKQLDEIFDLIAVRVIVSNVRDCYAVLGHVHNLWKPIPGRFKDYIAMPKTNMYQSLHTTVIGDNGDPFEIQIRTYAMNQVAEYGIAAHWKYKEGDSSGKTDESDMKLAWLRQTLEWQKDTEDPVEFMESLKLDLFETQVYVFTPKGDVIELPAESTPLDFAFKIHSDVGARCVGAKINGKMVTIDHVLQNGDIIEIVTSSNSSGPSMDWLKIAKSSHARTKIRNWLKKENKSDDLDKGKDNIDKYLRKKGYDPKLVCKNAYLLKAVKNANMTTLSEMYIQVSHGGSILAKIGTSLITLYKEDKAIIDNQQENDIKELTKKKENLTNKNYDNAGVIVKGYDNLMIRVSRCCNPVPGDEIVGFITKGRGISVHRTDCSNIVNLPESEKSRFIEVEWEDLKAGKSYYADITVEADDRKGLFSDISKTCEDMNVHIAGVNMKTGKGGDVNMVLTLSINSTQQIQKVSRKLRNIQGVTQVFRAKV